MNITLLAESMAGSLCMNKHVVKEWLDVHYDNSNEKFNKLMRSMSNDKPSVITAILNDKEL